jgi:hypothetical protein
MAHRDTRTTEKPTQPTHCAHCGHRIDDSAVVSERFGETLCSEAHAEQFAEGVRQARIAAVARRRADGEACSLPPVSERTWKDYVKRGACWGAPLLLLLAIPMFWSGSTLGIAGGSLLSVLAALACPLGMYFMMRAMMNMGHHDAPPRTEPVKDDSTRKALVLLVLAAGLTAAPATHAGEPPHAAPAFEHVHALALDAAGRALWLGTHTGLFRSEDGGRTWAKVALPSQHHAPDVMAIATHPVEGGVMYIGTHEAGVFRTTDGGSTWTSVNSALGGLDVHGLAIDPNSPAKLHALVRDKGAGVYRTTDGGQKWVRVDDGPAGETKVLASVDIPTGMGGIFLYAGTGEGLLRNPDCF